MLKEVANPVAPSGSGRVTAGADGETVHILHQIFRRAGGMESYALMLSQALRALGCHVVVHAREGDPELAQNLGVELRLVPAGGPPRKLGDYRYFRHVDSHRREWGGRQIALSRVRAQDLVVCGGTQRGYLQRAKRFIGPFDLLQLWMEREAYLAARTIVSHSDLCTRELIGLYRVPREKILTLHPPVEARFRPPESLEQRSRHRQRFGFPEDKVVLVFPSMGHRRKGLKTICRALEAFAGQVLLVVAGKPSAEEQPFVRTLGYIDDMPALYQAADFTILGSYYEAFGLVGVESVRCGTRLIFEENIGCLDAIDPAEVLRFSVWDPDSIRSAVERGIDMVRQRQHRIGSPAESVRYNPSPRFHAETLLTAARRRTAA